MVCESYCPHLCVKNLSSIRVKIFFYVKYNDVWVLHCICAPLPTTLGIKGVT